MKRRGFLKTLLGGIAAVAVAPLHVLEAKERQADRLRGYLFEGYPMEAGKWYHYMTFIDRDDPGEFHLSSEDGYYSVWKPSKWNPGEGTVALYARKRYERFGEVDPEKVHA